MHQQQGSVLSQGWLQEHKPKSIYITYDINYYMGKMNKLFLTTILILCLPIVTALHGGETWIYNFPNCNMLEVNITGTLPIIDGEYIILNNCTGNNNSFVCECHDDYNFNVSFKINAVNNYTFDFNYDYTKVVSTPTSSGGSSSGGYSSSWICGNWSDCIDNKSIRDCWKGTNKNINYTQSKSCVSETKEPEKKEEVKVTETKAENKTEIIENITAVIVQNETKVVLPTKEDEGWIYLGIIIITIAFIIFGFYVIKNKRDSNSDSERSKKVE